MLSSCAIFGSQKVRHSRSTSLVKFLYPDAEIPADVKNPVLNLPLKVGLAFIPSSTYDSAVSQATKVQLLEQFKILFEQKVYVDTITVIPEMYLGGRNGFTTLEQLKQVYNLDVIALVSYDQIVNRSENLLALTYLTIVGAYIFPGTNYKVSTLIDLALIDIDSRQMLFRAAGTSASKGQLPEAYRHNAYDNSQNQDFLIAMDMVQNNLQTELVRFEQRLREKRPNENITVKHREGFSGSFNLMMLLLLGLLAIVSRVKKST